MVVTTNNFLNAIETVLYYGTKLYLCTPTEHLNSEIMY
jgi:hypothetical protein